METTIYVDFGNSLIKCWFRNKVYRFYYQHYLEFNEFLMNYHVTQVYMISTLFQSLDWFDEICSYLKIKVYQINNKDVIPYIKVSPKLAVQQLGIDLALQTFYLQQEAIQDAIVITYGTWTTMLEITDGKLENIGILPGITQLHATMFCSRKKQPMFSHQGKNNEQVFGFANYLLFDSLINWTIQKQKILVISGWHALEITKKFTNKNKFLYIKDLTVKGLYYFINFIINSNDKHKKN